MDIASALLAYLETDRKEGDADPFALGKFLLTCTDDERRAALELLAAAALDDGTLSESERTMLERHDGDAKAHVQRALTVVQSAMPFAGDAERRRFLAERADVVRNAEERERLLGACVAVLENAAAPNLEARCLIFTSALGLSDAALARVRAR